MELLRRAAEKIFWGTGCTRAQGNVRDGEKGN
jgi:hypothetical protein